MSPQCSYHTHVISWYGVKNNWNMDWLTCFLTIIGLLLWMSTKRPKNFPSGLRRIPIIGQIMTGSKPKLSMKASSIVGMFIPNYPTVMIQNFKLAKDLMNQEEWCVRHSNITSRFLTKPCSSILWGGCIQICYFKCYFTFALKSTVFQEWFEKIYFKRNIKKRKNETNSQS
jgi:hypothetical protein